MKERVERKRGRGDSRKSMEKRKRQEGFERGNGKDIWKGKKKRQEKEMRKGNGREREGWI